MRLNRIFTSPNLEDKRVTAVSLICPASLLIQSVCEKGCLHNSLQELVEILPIQLWIKLLRGHFDPAAIYAALGILGCIVRAKDDKCPFQTLWNYNDSFNSTIKFDEEDQILFYQTLHKICNALPKSVVFFMNVNNDINQDGLDEENHNDRSLPSTSSRVSAHKAYFEEQAGYFKPEKALQDILIAMGSLEWSQNVLDNQSRMLIIKVLIFGFHQVSSFTQVVTLHAAWAYCHNLCPISDSGIADSFLAALLKGLGNSIGVIEELTQNNKSQDSMFQKHLEQTITYYCDLIKILWSLPPSECPRLHSAALNTLPKIADMTQYIGKSGMAFKCQTVVHFMETIALINGHLTGRNEAFTLLIAKKTTSQLVIIWNIMSQWVVDILHLQSHKESTIQHKHDNEVHLLNENQSKGSHECQSFLQDPFQVMNQYFFFYLSKVIRLTKDELVKEPGHLDLLLPVTYLCTSLQEFVQLHQKEGSEEVLTRKLKNSHDFIKVLEELIKDINDLGRMVMENMEQGFQDSI